MIDYNKLSNMQLDALKEVGNIGAAHAAMSLSQIIKKTIMINVSMVTIIPISEIYKIVGKPEDAAVVIRMHVLGDVRGEIILALAMKNAIMFVDILEGHERGDSSYLDEIGQSALKEAGSILAASYLRSIGQMLNSSLIPSAPNLMNDKMGKIAQNVLQEITKRAEIAFCIETEFIESGSKIEGHFLLIPALESLEFILNTLGVMDK